MIDLTAGLVLSAAGLVLLAGVVQGASGFGFGIVSMALLPLVVDAKSAAVFVAVTAPVVSGWIWRDLRGAVAWSLAVPMLISMILIGLPIGTLLLRLIPEAPLRLVIGAVVITAAVTVMLLRRPSEAECARPTGKRAAAWAWPVGALAGLLAGLVSMPGPPIVVFLALLSLGKRENSATLQAVFTVGSTARLPMLALAGQLDGARVLVGLGLIAVVILGASVGLALFRRLPARALRVVIVVLLLAAGGKQIHAGIRLDAARPRRTSSTTTSRSALRARARSFSVCLPAACRRIYAKWSLS